MPFSSPFVHFRINGGFGNSTTPVERWSVGFKLRQSQSGSPDGNQLSNFLAAVEPAVKTFHSSVNQAAGSTAFVTELTAAYVGTDGLYVGGPLQQTTKRAVTVTNGGGGTAIHPFYVACVYTLKTLLPRGPASSGRFYWPALAQSVTAISGDFQSTQATTKSTEGASFIAAINTAAAANITGNSGVYVMSQVGTGGAAPVVAVRVGRRLDVQRRRSNDVLESYATAPVTGALAMLDQRDRTAFENLREWEQERSGA